MLCARRADRLDVVAAEIVAAGGQALPLVADVTSRADMDALVAGALERFGRLDVMMCNAGFGVAGAIDEVGPEQMQKLMDVNYTGTYHATRAALAVFRRQQSGHLIIVSSIVGRRGVPYMGAYAATKFAQVGLAECLRAELRGSNIHVTVVFPVSTATEFFDVMSHETGVAVTRARRVPGSQSRPSRMRLPAPSRGRSRSSTRTPPLACSSSSTRWRPDSATGSCSASAASPADERHAHSRIP